jgi:cytidylate kinase
MGEAASAVMEGRDIGTVVFPDAVVKVFLDASAEERARRRTEELAGKGLAQDAGHVLREINERDHRDRNRAAAPLMQAPDAAYLDSTGLTIEEVEERIMALVRSRTANGKEYKR